MLGSGCKTCQKLYGDVKKAAAEVCPDAEVLHITDIRILAERGISATPAVFINGKVVSMGKVLSDAQIKQLILSSVSGS